MHWQKLEWGCKLEGTEGKANMIPMKDWRHKGEKQDVAENDNGVGEQR